MSLHINTRGLQEKLRELERTKWGIYEALDHKAVFLASKLREYTKQVSPDPTNLKATLVKRIPHIRRRKGRTMRKEIETRLRAAQAHYSALGWVAANPEEGRTRDVVRKFGEIKFELHGTRPVVHIINRCKGISEVLSSHPSIVQPALDATEADIDETVRRCAREAAAAANRFFA